MQESNFSFLILNYRNVEETIKCIESIKDAGYKNSSIIIVDNGSADGSYEKICDLYQGVEDIYIIKSDANLGFSGGNNLGYTFIRENLNPDFLVVTNNDVLFPQKDMLSRIQNNYQQTNFYVLGPDIYVRKNHEHQSPMMLNLPSKEDIEKELHMYEFYLKNPDQWVTRRKAQTIKNRMCQSNAVIRNVYNAIKRKRTIDYSRYYENCCVQGACIIVSKKYIKAEEKMFTPETFLYCEELLLYKKCMNKNYLMVYDPEIQIWHEDSSTMKKINANALEKAKFTLPHHVKALEIVLDKYETAEMDANEQQKK